MSPKWYVAAAATRSPSALEAVRPSLVVVVGGGGGSSGGQSQLWSVWTRACSIGRFARCQGPRLPARLIVFRYRLLAFLSRRCSMHAVRRVVHQRRCQAKHTFPVQLSTRRPHHTHIISLYIYVCAIDVRFAGPNHQRDQRDRQGARGVVREVLVCWPRHFLCGSACRATPSKRPLAIRRLRISLSIYATQAASAKWTKEIPIMRPNPATLESLLIDIPAFGVISGLVHSVLIYSAKSGEKASCLRAGG